MGEPTIPLKHAELLHVALSTVVHVIETRTDYPIDNIEKVVAAYRVSRDKYLTGVGYSKEQIKLHTEAAVEALVTWLEEREAKKKSALSDFDQWARELLDEDQK